MYGIAASAMIGAVKEREAFDEYCKTLSEHEAKAARKARKERLELQAQRNHELDCARASRSDSGGLMFGLGVLLGIGID
jgi:hypothetical protein